MEEKREKKEEKVNERRDGKNDVVIIEDKTLEESEIYQGEMSRRKNKRYLKRAEKMEEKGSRL